MRLPDRFLVRRSFLLLGGVGIVPGVVEAQTTAMRDGFVRSENPAAGDAFASSMHLHGDRLAVGAAGVAQEAGAVSLYQLTLSAGLDEVQTVSASDGQPGDRCGETVGRGEGSNGERLLAVGAPTADGAGPDTGAVYLFEEVSGSFVERAKLFHSDLQADDRFGNSIVLHGDSVIVGCPGDDDLGVDSGTVQVFAPLNGAYVRPAKFEGSSTAARYDFGRSLAIAGDRLVVGAPASLISAS